MQNVEKLLRNVYQLGIESTFSPAKARARDNELERIIKKVLKKEC